MADIDLSLGFTIEQASIRKIQSDINRTFRDTTPEVNVKLAPDFRETLKRTIGGQAFTIEQLDINPQLIDAINKEIGRVVERIEIKEININQRAIDNVKREIAEATIRSEAFREFEKLRTARPGGTGAVGRAGPRLREATGVDPSISTERVTKLRQEEEEKLAQALARERLIREKISQEAGAGQAEEKRFVQQLNDARKDLRNQVIGASDAQRIAARLIRQGADAARERAQQDPATQAIRDNRNRLARLLGQEANITQSLVDDFSEQEGLVQKEQEAIRRATAIRNDLNTGLITARDAQRQVNNLRRRDPVSSTVRDPAVAGRLEAELNKELQAAQNLVRFKEIQAENAKVSADAQSKQQVADQANIRAAQKLNSISVQQQNDIIDAASARKRLESIEINAQGALARTIQTRLSSEKTRLQTVIDERAQEEEDGRLLRERIAIQRQINQNLLQQAGIGKKQIDLANQVARQIQAELVEAQRGGSRQFAQQQRDVAPSDVLFRNGGDVRQFTESLNPQELEKFTNSLKNLCNTTQRTQGKTENLGKSLGKNDDVTKKLNKNVQRGANLAQEFGRQVGVAAVRLLAWAAPANLIFQTVSRLRQAVNEIINIDREARRLIFFRNVGSIVTGSTLAFKGNADAIRELNIALKSTTINVQGITQATSRLVATNEDLKTEFSLTASIARDYGLTMGAVQDALVTVSRVGQQATDSTGRVASVFAQAALQLVRLEKGALGATEAVRGLTAIQAQFFGGIRGNVFTVLADEAGRAATAAELTSNAAALLAVTSAGSSANVSELTDAATRLGSAFVNLQGLNFEQTIAILGEAFTSTGASTGRLATALRQSATLIKQNAEEINEITSGRVQVVDEGGRVRGFQAILDVLKEIKTEAGSLKAVDLSLAIADRRNVADVAALAQNVEALQAAFDKFSDPIRRANAILAAQQVQIANTESLAQSLEGRITSLGTAFKQLVSGTAVRDFLSGVVGGLTGVVDVVSSVVGAIGALTTAFEGGPAAIFAIIGGFAIGKLAAGAIDLARGFNLAFGAAAKTTREVQKAEQQLRIETNTLSAITKLEQQRLITQQQAAIFESEITAIRGNLALETARLLGLTEAINAERIRAVPDEQRLERLIVRRGVALEDIIFLRKQERDAIRGITVEAERLQAVQTGGSGRLRALGGTAVILGTVATQLDVVPPSFKSGIQGAILGGIAGAQLGKAGGPLGIIFGFLAGFFGDELESVFARVAKNLKVSIGAALSVEAEQAIAFAEKATSQANQLDEVRASINKKLEDADSATAELLRKELELLSTVRARVTAQQEATLETIKATQEAEKSEDISAAGLVGRSIVESIPVLGAALILRRLDAEEETRLVLEEQAKILKANERTNATLTATTIESAQAQSDKADEVQRERDLIIEIGALIRRNEELQTILAAVNGNVITQKRAEEELQKNINRLQEQEIAKLGVVQFANQIALITLREQEDTLKRINRQATIRRGLLETLSLSTAGTSPTLKFDVQTQQFEDAVRLIEDTLAAQVKNLTILGRVGLETGKEINDLREESAKKILDLQLKELNNLANRQKSLLNDATTATVKQISAWEKASKLVASTFTKVVAEQKKLADIFGSIGEANASIIDTSSQRVSQFLEESGSSIVQRLAIVAQNTSARLERARATTQGQLGTLGDRFAGPGAAAGAAENLINSIAASAAGAQQEIVDKQNNIVRSQIAFNREQARAERADFQRRVGETRREIEIRRALLNTEIEILNNRLEAERELNALRRDQLEQFGSLLIESPKKFKKELDNIKLAERFFAGITDLSEESLRTIRSRSQQLRGRGAGGQELLRQVQAGLQSAVRFGRGDIAGGIGNRQLGQIFAAAQDDTVATLKEVASLAQRQIDEASGQLEEQKEIRARQQRLVELSTAEASLQQIQVRLTEANARIAVQQRARQITELTNIISKQEDTRKEFEDGFKNLLAFFSGDLTGNVGANQIQTLLSGGAFQQGLGNFLQNIINQFREVRNINGAIQLFGELGKAASIFQENLDASTEKEAEQKQQLIQETEKYIEILQKSTTGLEVFADFLDTTARGDEDSRTETIQASSRAFRKFISDLSLTSAGLGRVSAISGQAAAELTKLNDAEASGEQLTRQELRRRRELQRETRRGFRGGDTNRIAESILENSQASQAAIGGIRQLVLDTARTDEFIDRARRLRGEGARGARDVSVGAAQELAENAGLSGAAADIVTRGDATEFLDTIIGLSESLAREQGKISRETQKEIVKILGQELTPGIQKIISEASTAIEGQFAPIDNRIFAELANVGTKVSVEAVQVAAKAAAETVSEVINASKDTFADGVKQAIEEGAQKIGEVPLKVEVGKVEAEVVVRTTDVLSAGQLSTLLKEALTPLVGNAQEVAILAANLTKVITELQKRRIIPPFIPNPTTPAVDSVLKEVPPKVVFN